ncbi:MAG: tetratricopeptide repeat protein [Deltaproteobacteria bacterium]|nr:tetratricopeptide repeat protein [Deltaproteobacteria bacterium]
MTVPLFFPHQLHFPPLAPRGLIGLLLLALLLIGCDGGRASFTPDDIAANNRGVGLMGRFAYEDARAVFADLVQRHPDWWDAQVNLAIATFNRQQTGDEESALNILGQVLQADAHHLRAHYCRGLLLLNQGKLDEALIHLRVVAEADPMDAYAHYFIAQVLMQQQHLDQAIQHYQSAVTGDPYLRSAYYGAFQALRRASRTDDAKKMLEEFQRLQTHPQARLAELKYTRMGPKASAMTVDQLGAPPARVVQGPLFLAPQQRVDPPTDLRWQAGDRAVNLTASDVNQDGQLDLFIANAFDGTTGVHNAILTGAPADGRFMLLRDHPLARVAEVNAVAWGDVDNDGLTDAYLCRRGPNQLWRQQPAGTWTDITTTAQVDGGNADTRDCFFVDADHDGDLDLFLVNADAPLELLNNNLDGTFRPLAATAGLAHEGRAARAILPADMDNDRDVDLLVLYVEPPHAVFLNDRVWHYHAAPGFDVLQTTASVAAVAADTNVDGHPELYTLTPLGAVQRWQADTNGTWQPTPLLQLPQPGAAPNLAVLDVTGDGMPELLVSTASGWAVYRLEGTGTSLLFDSTSPALSCATWVPLVLTPASGPAVAGWCGNTGLQVWPPGPGRFRFASLTLSGLVDAGQQTRSNASGIGAKVTARIGSRWTAVETLRPTSASGQSLQPLAVGIGDEERIDFVAIDWSDGVFQSELDLAAGQHHRITETQRQLSSCPLLFAWDGARYAFVSDILGVAGLGYATGPGEYAPPRPWENFLLPPGLLQSHQGHYQLKVVQPMEEATYLDSARLVSYDLPPGWDLALDERMGINGPAPSGQPLFFQHEMEPLQAVNERGEDVTARVTTADLRAAPPGPLDPRFLGRLQSEHLLTLTFAQPLESRAGQPLLLIDGWVEYPYSQTMFAAWQAGAAYIAPTLEARTVAGQWVVVQEQFGYPAGMPRRMTFPLMALPKGTTTVRLRTNMEIYWDRIAIAYAEPCPEARRVELPVRDARLATVGFPLRTTNSQRVPHYDYARRTPLWDTRHLAGAYTALGPIAELITHDDDAVAIFGPGEEVHVEFTAPLTPLPGGWTRRFVLETGGWTKDMDLYTKDGETLAPLPTTGKAVETRERLHGRYQTRYEAGR